jgi:hypothetical protein
LIAPIPGSPGPSPDGKPDGAPLTPPDGGPPPFNPPIPPFAPVPENPEEGMWATPNPAGGLAFPTPGTFPVPGLPDVHNPVPLPNDLNIIGGRPQVPLPAPDGTVANALSNAVDTGP